MKTPVRLLYIEDDEMDRRAFLRMVQEKGLSYETTAAGTLAEARAHLAGSRFDVIVADHHLPDGHCTELFEEIKDTPIILLTDTLKEQLALRALDRDIDDYLTKDSEQRHLEAVPFMVEKTLYCQFLKHQLSARLVSHDNLQTLLDAILDAALAITSADKGHVQLLNIASGELAVTAQRGFDSAFVEFFSHIRPGVVACGTAIKTRQCVVVEDATLSPLFLAEPRALELVLAAGMRAVVCTPLLTRAGQLVGVLSILFAAPHRPSERDLRLLDLLARQAADFIERTQAEEAQAQLAAIVKWSEDAILSKSLDGTIRTWNVGAQRMFGYRAEEVIGRPVTLLIPPERVDEENRVLEQIKRGEPIEHFETVRVTKDGRRLDVSLTISPVKDSQGRITGASKIARDIGELVQARQILARGKEDLERLVNERTAELREALGELEQFSYTITHDMRAPLRAMQGFAGILTEECSQRLSATQREYLHSIAESADRMDKLITDALQYSGALHQQPELEPVDSDALLRGILESYPNFQPPRVHIHIDNRLPIVLGNKAAMTQCFSNLLSNAVKFVQPGKTPEVRIWAEERSAFPSAPSLTSQLSTSSNPFVRIWFEDKGIGIEKQYHDKIWEMFQQLNKSYEGTGIGLALVRKVVDRMGGKAGVESEPGHGSRFWIELRRASAPPPTKPLTPDRPQ